MSKTAFKELIRGNNLTLWLQILSQQVSYLLHKIMIEIEEVRLAEVVFVFYEIVKGWVVVIF